MGPMRGGEHAWANSMPDGHCRTGHSARTGWVHPGANTADERYSGADQINTANVHEPEVVCTVRTGDLHESDGVGAEDQNTPQQIGDSLYVCTAYSQILALDPDTGEEKWRYDPGATSPSPVYRPSGVITSSHSPFRIRPTKELLRFERG